MPDGADEPDSYKLLMEAWDAAEEAIKQAENINGEVIVPAVAELRYAGRRMIDALQKRKNKEFDEADKLHDDACFFCHRARHDA